MPFTPMKKPSILLAVLLAVCSGASASEEMRQVQEELRKRNLYFGDIDGKATPEIQGALRRYQERKGFPASGDLCPLTRKSLNLAQLPETSVAANWPEETVLKSDAARHVSEADQKFLDAIAEQDEMAEDEDLGAVAPLAESRTPTVEKSRPTVEVSTPPPVAAAPEAPYEDLVREYLAASATNTPDQELGFYADQVDYFDHGKVGRDFIENDVQNYRKRWPQRKYELLDLKVLPGTGDERIVRFRIAFEVKNQRHSASGKTDNTFRVRESGGTLRFTALKEKRLRQ